ncbi:hypothetical protein D5085_04015 [Ectothiorhodospiraceae bacterium BW-2]|nr:hypothetical protein D5085_04015 [Ectothiorhodospiraceae bacterium BW-2]
MRRLQHALLPLLPALWVGITLACDLPQGVAFTPDQLNRTAITAQLEKLEELHLPQQLQQAEQQVATCRQQSQQQLSTTITQYDTLFTEWREFNRLHEGLATTRRQQEEYRQATLKQQQDLPEQLEQIELRGLYLTLLQHNLSPLKVKVDAMKRLAESLLAATAIPELNGIFIHSITEITTTQMGNKSQQSFKDSLTQRMSGQLAIGQRPVPGEKLPNKQFYTLTEVVVTPLKAPLPAQSGIQRPGSAAELVRSVVINLDSADWATHLADFSLDAATTATIDAARSRYIGNIRQQNQNQQQRQQALINTATEALATYQTRLSELTTLEQQQRQALQQLYATWQRPCREKDPLACRPQGNAYLQQQLVLNLQQRRTTLSGELFASESFPVYSQGSFADAIANNAIGSISDFIRSHQQSTAWQQQLTIDNGLLTQFNLQQLTTPYRRLDHFWLMVTEAPGNGYSVRAFSRFRFDDNPDIGWQLRQQLLGNPAILVLPASSEQGDITPFGEQLRQQLQQQLRNSGLANLRPLPTPLKELLMPATAEAFSDPTMQTALQRSGAEVLINGSYQTTPEGSRVVWLAWHIAQQRLLTQLSAAIPTPVESGSATLNSYRTALIRRAESRRTPTQITLNKLSGHYCRGEEAWVDIRLTEPRYLTLLTLGADNSVTRYTPNRLQPSRREPAGALQFPPAAWRSQQKMNLTLYPLPGQLTHEQFLLISSRELLDLSDIPVPEAQVGASGTTLRQLYQRLQPQPDAELSLIAYQVDPHC